MGWAEGIGGKWLELLQEAVPQAFHCRRDIQS